MRRITCIPVSVEGVSSGLASASLVETSSGQHTNVTKAERNLSLRIECGSGIENAVSNDSYLRRTSQSRPCGSSSL